MHGMEKKPTECVRTRITVRRIRDSDRR